MLKFKLFTLFCCYGNNKNFLILKKKKKLEMNFEQLNKSLTTSFFYK